MPDKHVLMTQKTRRTFCRALQLVMLGRRNLQDFEHDIDTNLLSDEMFSLQIYVRLHDHPVTENEEAQKLEQGKYLEINSTG